MTRRGQAGVVATADKGLPTSPHAGGRLLIPGEALQHVKAKELIAFILFYLVPFEGEVTEGGGDLPLEVHNDFFGFVFEEQLKVIILPIVGDLMNRVPVMTHPPLRWGQGWLCHI